MNRYPRDMIGYGPDRPDAQWPNGAKIAVQFVLNYEEGGENNLLHGDAGSEGFLSDIPGATPWENMRHWNMESIYEYGARAGFWRLHRLFTQRDIPLTIYGVATALARSPEQVEAMKDAGWEIASHGLKWIEHRDMPAEEERAQIDEAFRLHQEVTGSAPRGWYTGRCSMNTIPLLAETGALDYLSDTYDDDLPYWRTFGDRDQLIIPYTLEANDMRFSGSPGWVTGQDFGQYLINAFDTLRAEGHAGRSGMMSVGLHCRLIGRPAKIAGLVRFLDHIAQFDDVWTPRRIDIAEHWQKTHPPSRPQLIPSQMGKDEFVAQFGDIYENSAWVAERAFGLELGPAHDRPAGLANALARVFRSAEQEERLAVLNAHPDLAGRLALAKKLTAASAAEQHGAGLDALTDQERETFTELNTAYMSKHGFPFIIAVRDHTKGGILTAFETRLSNTTDVEFEEACRQVERIGRLRLEDLL